MLEFCGTITFVTRNRGTIMGSKGQRSRSLGSGNENVNKIRAYIHIHCVQKKNTHSHFLSYLHELFVDLNKNCIEYTQGLTDSDNVKIRYLLRLVT